MTTRTHRRSSSDPPRRAAARMGLALAGGGPLGGIYEVGALLALADSIRDFDPTALDVYVGVSSGGFVAAALANGISPSQMYRLFVAEAADAPMKPALFLQPALREFARRAAGLPRLAWRALAQYARDPLDRGLMASLATLARALPTGVFDQRAVDAFVGRLFAVPGRTNDFRALRSKLYVVATNLDTGASVAFGRPGHDHVPISLALTASSALPGVFAPVEIDAAHYVDGALNKTLHASLALDEGVSLLLCINPLVPFDASRERQRGRAGMGKLDRGGLPRVLGQTFRAVIRSRMQAAMAKYARAYPHADVVLFEPPRENADMFLANIFGYAQRERVCALAFDATRANLRERSSSLAPVLARHGLSLDRGRLADHARGIAAALTDARPLRISARRDVRQTTRDLAYALEHLERRLALLA
jgi:predicted acylesterase/phospholipase RssA